MLCWYFLQMFNSSNKNTSPDVSRPGKSSVVKRRMVVPHLQESGILEPDLPGFSFLICPRVPSQHPHLSCPGGSKAILIVRQYTLIPSEQLGPWGCYALNCSHALPHKDTLMSSPLVAVNVALFGNKVFADITKLRCFVLVLQSCPTL